jgi:hypothetical protein
MRFMNKRQNINCSNQFLGYLFYLIQTLSVFGNSWDNILKMII